MREVGGMAHSLLFRFVADDFLLLSVDLFLWPLPFSCASYFPTDSHSLFHLQDLSDSPCHLDEKTLPKFLLQF